MRVTRASLAALLALIALTIGVYVPGLQGPFLLDDFSVLGVVERWLAGNAGLTELLFGNTSFANHRSLSMGSFALSAWVGGIAPLSFKAGNLAIHIGCTLIIWVLAGKLARRDERLVDHSAYIALGIACVWTLHPLFVSTVLYAVQRMAQLSAIFCLLGMWLYTSVRERMIDGRFSPVKGSLFVFAGISILTVLGILAKQNAAILPVLCLVIELGWFRPSRPRPRNIQTLFWLTLLVPLTAGGLGLGLRWQDLQVAYLDYDFTLGERLLSFPRVLADYIKMTFVPYTPSMGVFTDDYEVSRGLFQPWTTASAWAAMVAISIAAWFQRIRYKTFFGGWFIFLAGHLIEGTILPLELYYEHRNYLPAFGLLLAAAAILSPIAQRLSSAGIRLNRVGAVIGTAVLLLLVFQTVGRVRIWENDFTIAATSIEAHPQSFRAHTAYATAALRLGRPDLAYIALSRFERRADQRNRALAAIYKIILDCRTKRSASKAELHRAADTLPPKVILNTPYVFAYLAATEQEFGCGEVSAETVADATAGVAARVREQPAGSIPIMSMRYTASQSYIRAGNLEEALRQGRLAWQPEAEPATSQVLVAALLGLRRTREAEIIYRQATQRMRNARDAAGMKSLELEIEQARQRNVSGKEGRIDKSKLFMRDTE